MANPQQPRHLAGTPKSQGGQYRVERLEERDEPLDPLATPASWWERATSLLSETRDDRFVQLGAPGGDAPDPIRRYPRIRYGGDDVELRMPSVTRIHAALNDSPDQVGVQIPLGYKLEGESGMATARIERTAAGRWFARVDGVDPQTNAVLSEAIASAVESRRPRMIPHDIETLLARRRERVAAVGTESTSVPTSFIKAVAYDDKTGVLAMQLARSSHAHGYVVPREVYEELLSAHDPGAAYNTLIKGSQKSHAERCEKCGRFTFVNAEGGHTCPPTALRDHVPVRTEAALPAPAERAPETVPAEQPPATPEPVSAPPEATADTTADIDWDIPKPIPQPSAPTEPPQTVPDFDLDAGSGDDEWPDPWPGEPVEPPLEPIVPPTWWGDDPDRLDDTVEFPDSWTDPHTAIFGATPRDPPPTRQTAPSYQPGPAAPRSMPQPPRQRVSWARRGLASLLRGIGVTLRRLLR